MCLHDRKSTRLRRGARWKPLIILTGDREFFRMPDRAFDRKPGVSELVFLLVVFPGVAESQVFADLQEKVHRTNYSADF